MAIGNLDRRILLQTATQSQDSYGQAVETWATTYTVWSWVRYKGGAESVAANKNTVTADCVFTIRYRAGINEKMRISYDSVIYDILHIAEVGRKRYLELTAKKVE